MRQSFPRFAASTPEEIARLCNPIYLSVPSQAVPEIAQGIGSLLRDKVLLSSCAAVSCARLQQLFPGAISIRLFHNYACRNGSGVVVAYSENAPLETIAIAKKHLSQYGEVIEATSERAFLETAAAICFSAVLAASIDSSQDFFGINSADPELASIVLRKSARSILPLIATREQSVEFINAMSTPGGITEKGILEFQRSSNPLSALSAMMAALAALMHNSQK